MDSANLPIGISWYSVIAAWRNDEMPVSKFCDFARECGADGIEILDAFLYAPGVVRDHLPNTQSFEAELAENLSGLNLHAVAVTNDFAFKDPSRLLIEEQKIELGLKLASSFYSNLLRVFSAHPAEKSDEDVNLARTQSIVGLSKFAPSAQTLALENHGTVFGTPGEVIAISRGAGVGTCFDIGNWLLAGIDPVGAAHQMPFPDLIHVKDFRSDSDGAYLTPDGQRLSGAFLGEGDVPIRETLKALLSKPDRKPVPIDLELECGDRGIEATREGVKWLRSLLAQL